MVKLGFIVEGTTEKIVLGGSDFFNFLAGKKINFVQEIIDAGGNGNLLPHNISAFTEVLEEKGTTHIVILTDLDNDQCITNTKNRIAPLPNQIVIVSIKAIESWFLSDTAAIREYFKDTTFTHANPEIVNDPYEEIKLIRMAKQNRISQQNGHRLSLFYTKGSTASQL